MERFHGVLRLALMPFDRRNEVRCDRSGISGSRGRQSSQEGRQRRASREESYRDVVTLGCSCMMGTAAKVHSRSSWWQRTQVKILQAVVEWNASAGRERMGGVWSTRLEIGIVLSTGGLSIRIGRGNRRRCSSSQCARLSHQYCTRRRTRARRCRDGVGGRDGRGEGEETEEEVDVGWGWGWG